MNKHICSFIKGSKWLDIESISFMKIKKSTPIYSMVERISLNVAVTFNTNWININRANENQTMLYSAKIITALVIRSVMLSTYNMKKYEVNEFLGEEMVSCIEYYFNYINPKK